MTVIVNSRHFKDNTYHHSTNRMCPLNEALNELENGRWFVAFAYVTHRRGHDDHAKYFIPLDKWNSNIVNDYIRRANKGEEFNVEIELIKQ